MRNVILACAAALVAVAIGCSKSTGPVTVTPEMEAEQKAADKKVRDEESAHQKTQKPTRQLTGEEEEAQRAKQGRK